LLLTLDHFYQSFPKVSHQLLGRICRQIVQQVNGFLEVTGGQVGIAYGHLDVGVAQELLDPLQTGASHDQVGGDSVTEVVKTEIINPSLAAGGGKRPLHGFEPAALPITKHIGRYQLVLVPQLLEDFQQPAANGDMAGITTLGFDEMN
jgi:hypothetical protein